MKIAKEGKVGASTRQERIPLTMELYRRDETREKQMNAKLTHLFTPWHLTQ